MRYLRWILTAGLCAVLAVLSVQCGDSTGNDDPKLCTTDADCPANQICVGGICAPAASDGGVDGGVDGEADGGDVGGPAPNLEVVEPPLVGDPPVYQLNFGNVLVGETVQRQIRVRNSGDADLRIVQLNFEMGTDIDDFSIPPEQLALLPVTLAPDAEATFDIAYAATDGTTDHGILDVVSNDPDDPLVQIHLLSEFKGEVLPQLSTNTLDFGDVAVGSLSQPLTATLTNAGSGNAVLGVTDVRLDFPANPDFSLTVLDANGEAATPPVLLNNGDFLDLQVIYHPQAHEADAERVVALTDDPLHPSLEVLLAGRGVVGELGVDPSPVDLGRVRVGGHAEQVVVLTNNGGAVVELSGVALQNASTEWSLTSTDLDLASLGDTPHALDPTESVAVTLGIDPLDVGPETGTLLIDNSTADPQLAVALNAEGYVPAHVTTDPDPPLLVFQDVQWDQPTGTAESRTLAIDIGNDGGEALLVSNMQLLNASTQFTWAPDINAVQPGAQVSLQVTFTPTAAGNLNDKLLIDTNDPDIIYDLVPGRLAIDLQANAVDPALVVVPSGSHDFGTLSVGDTATLQVNLISASNDPLWILDIRLGAGGSADYSLANLPNLNNPLVGAGSSVTFDVVYAPSDVGVDPGIVEIESADIGNPLVTIVLTGTSQGCPAGFGDCDAGVPGCETELTSLVHCGACDQPCDLANASESCATGTCEIVACEGTWDDCDGVTPNGCEEDTTTSTDHCLFCGNACAYDHAGAVCGGAGCEMGACDADWWDIDGSDANGCEYSCVFQSATDDPDAFFVDANCDGIDGEVARAVFVSSGTGSDLWPGTQAQPVATVSHGLVVAQNDPAKDYLIVAGGTYNRGTTLGLADGVSIYGGYDSADWSRGPSNVTRIVVTASTAVTASGLSSTTTLDMLTITGGSNTSPGGSAYGIRASNSDGLRITSCSIQAGLGGSGTAGSSPGGIATGGSNGTAGDPGCEDSSWPCTSCSRPQGGDGGSSPCSRPGGEGGDAGHGSSNGTAGTWGTFGAPGGSGAPDDQGNWNPPNGHACIGADGGNGAPGSNGAAGAPAFGSGGYTPSNGGGGLLGSHGNGGGGGGGGGGGTADCDSYGGGGGGGGGGGCRGAVATGGGSGGGSFAVYLWGSNAFLENCTLTTSAGGNAGSGGTGQPGGPGGAPGTGVLSNAGSSYGGSSEQDDGSNGCRGGWGGTGGRGGHGGGGAGGASIGVLVGGGSMPTLSNNAYSLGSSGSGGFSPGNDGPVGLRTNTHTP